MNQLHEVRQINEAAQRAAYGRSAPVYCIPSDAPNTILRVMRARRRAGVLECKTAGMTRWARVLKVWQE